MKLKKHHETILYLIMIFLVSLALFWKHADAAEPQEPVVQIPTVYWQLYVKKFKRQDEQPAGLFLTWIECEDTGQHTVFIKNYVSHRCVER